MNNNYGSSGEETQRRADEVLQETRAALLQQLAEERMRLQAEQQAREARHREQLLQMRQQYEQAGTQARATYNREVLQARNTHRAERLQADQESQRRQQTLRQAAAASMQQAREEADRQARSLREQQSLAGRRTYAAAGVVAGATSQVQGLYQRGLQGTVNQAQTDWELKQLGRELVAVFRPVIEVTLRVTRSVRQWMQSLDETGQNLLMLGGLLAVGGGLYAKGNLLFGGGSRLAAMVAPMAMAAGGGLGGLGGLAAAGGTWWLGSRLLGGRAGATAAGASGATAAGAGAAGAGAAGAGAAGAGRGLLSAGGAALRVAGKAFVATSALMAGMDLVLGDTYSQMRKVGYSTGTAVLGHVGGAVVNAVTGITDALGLTDGRGWYRRSLGLSDGESRGRRSAGIQGAGFEDLGAAYDAVNLAISRVQTPGEQYLREIRDLLRRERHAPPRLAAPGMQYEDIFSPARAAAGGLPARG